MITKIYIVNVKTGYTITTSQEAYRSYEAAKEFVISRGDKPEMVSPYMFKSKHNIYLITDVTVRN